MTDDAPDVIPVVAPRAAVVTLLRTAAVVAQSDGTDDDAREQIHEAANAVALAAAGAEDVGHILEDAFVAGFEQSGEGYNGEYPFAHDTDEIREALAEDFSAWVDDYYTDDDALDAATRTYRCPDCGASYPATTAWLDPDAENYCPEDGTALQPAVQE